MLLKIGDLAPDFTLQSSDGNTVRLSDYFGKNSVVLIFYPGDHTPGCTKQLCAIRDDFSAFQKKTIMVFGVNPATIGSHQSFVKAQGFPFPLLVDINQTMAKNYGCDSWPMVKRTVYAINKKGEIVFVASGMPSPDEILNSIPDEQ